MAQITAFENGNFAAEPDIRIIKFNPNASEKETKEPKLKKDGTPKNNARDLRNKPKGTSSMVEPLEIEDMKKLMAYFQEKEQWLPYLIFVLSCNMARRIGDTMSLTWENFYNPETGKIRNDLKEIAEQKTDKLANPRINVACRDAIELYIEKTGCDPAKDDYKVPICMQLYGTYKGSVMTTNGYHKALKRAAKNIGIEYNIGTHSPRKTFGKLNRMIHPNDYDSMEILQTIFNHSDTKTTKHYIGLTKQKVDKYYDDMGEFFNDYVLGDREYQFVSDSPIVNLEASDLRDIIKAAYELGGTNANETDAMVHVDAITNLMTMVDELKK